MNCLSEGGPRSGGAPEVAGAAAELAGASDGRGLAAAFALAPEGDEEALACGEVAGFDEAAAAADDPFAAGPPRLVLAAPSPRARAWLDAWAEDSVRVRRSLAIRRLRDGQEVRAVATLHAHGAGIRTVLALESVAAPRESFGKRSGVYPRVAVEAALARLEGLVGPAAGDLSGARPP